MPLGVGGLNQPLTCKMMEDYLPEFQGNYMDKKIKKLQKNTKKLVKEEASLLKADQKNDKIVDKAKAKMKGKC